MTELRRRMIQDMQLHGLAKTTQDRYVQAVRGLVKYCRRPADQITETQIRQFFVYLTRTQRRASGTVAVYLHGIKFFYQRTLGRRWPVFNLLRVKRPNKLPEVLSRQEVRQLLATVRTRVARMSLTMMYSCGLRVSEATRLRVRDIDGPRMVVCVRNGKGQRDRQVPLPAHILERLRAYWVHQRPKPWLFPSPNGPGPVHPRYVRECLKAALAQTNIRKHVTPHTLRHCYATHLLEQGVDIRLIQLLLGHKSVRTTCRYLHLTPSTQQAVQGVLNDLMADL